VSRTAQRSQALQNRVALQAHEQGKHSFSKQASTKPLKKRKSKSTASLQSLYKAAKSARARAQPLYIQKHYKAQKLNVSNKAARQIRARVKKLFKQDHGN